MRASIEKTVEEHRVDARLSDRERDGISLDETVKKESRAKDLLTPDERVRGGSNMRDILMRTPSKDKDRSLQYSPPEANNTIRIVYAPTTAIDEETRYRD